VSGTSNAKDRAMVSPLWSVLAFGFAIAVIAYAVLRVIAFATSREADPALVIWTEHAGYFWRATTSGFAGAFAAFSAALVPREKLAAALPTVIVIATIAIALQSAAIP
jgi:hypothetical protein